MQRQAASRLSSGYRVNSAADDAAGLAISESMRAQIRGLDQASINTQDGVGLIQTAEGAMATVSDMIIRMRELVVQAANDTYTYTNREMIQTEIDQLMNEINAVTFRTEFNTRTLLAGGLSGEGGGPSTPVSLQWMVFAESRVIGFGQPGGIVTTSPMEGSRNTALGRLPNVHYNSNNRNTTSIRSDVITLQNELNDLARRVAERKVQDPFIAFTPDDLSSMFEDVRDLDFSTLDLIPAERTELQAIASRVENMLRNATRAAENMFQTTQDQINALGGSGAVNMDGSTVFSGDAVMEWQASARDTLEAIRANFDAALNGLEFAMSGGLGDVMESMNQVIFSLVGTLGSAEGTDPVGATHAGLLDGTYTSAAQMGAGSGTDGMGVAAGVFLVDNNGTWEFNTEADGSGTAVTLRAGRVANATAASLLDGIYTTAAAMGAGTGTDGQQVAPGVFLVDDAGTWSFNTAADGSGMDVAFDTVAGTFTVPPSFAVPNGEGGPAEPPTNPILAEMELLLDFSLDVLGNVNLESNAMWFQIGPNAMQGTILQLKGIHTGILGGGRGDLATLIDVRDRAGLNITGLLDIIDEAEGIINIQRAQLGAVQNRLEFTRQSLDISSENLSAAESRIRDTDMAREMMRFTQAQVLQQAGISMLAQANQLPASILQLLQ